MGEVDRGGSRGTAAAEGWDGAGLRSLSRLPRPSQDPILAIIGSREIARVRPMNQDFSCPGGSTGVHPGGSDGEDHLIRKDRSALFIILIVDCFAASLVELVRYSGSHLLQYTTRSQRGNTP